MPSESGAGPLEQTQAPWVGHLAMLVFSALVAGSFSLGAMVANDIAPSALNGARFLLAAGVIGVIAWARGGINRQAFRAPWRYVVLGGLFATYFVLMFEGLKTAAPVSTSAVFTLTPVMAGAAAFVVLGQGLTRRLALGLAVGGLGALWVIFRADFSAFLGFDVGRGEVIYFIGCIAYAIYTPMVRKLSRGEPAVVFTFGLFLAGFAILLVFGWRDILATDWLHLSGLVWITLIYTAVFASAATFVLLQIAVLRLPAAKVMAYTYLTPSWVILWEIALGRTPPPAIVLPGVALTIVALLILVRDETKAA